MKIIFINMVLTLLLFEISGVVFFYKQKGEFYYTRVIPGKSDSNSEFKKANKKASSLLLHPYLGYIRRPSMPVSKIVNHRLDQFLVGLEDDFPSWLSLRSNNYGFFSEHNYPYFPEENDYVIGVFGGSVAHWFALQGAERLGEHLSKNTELSNRNIQILNFAQAGYKQPQQLQALTYFLALGQTFDFVLNIDGFNEIALSPANHRRGVSPAIPSLQHLIPMLEMLHLQEMDLESLKLIYNMRRLSRLRNYSKSAGAHMVFSVLSSRARTNYLNYLQRRKRSETLFVENSVLSLSKLTLTSDSPTAPERVLSIWGNASLAMQQLCSSREIPYLEVVQPNQYFSEKTFSEKERSIAIMERSPFRTAVEKRYPKLDNHLNEMQSLGIRIVSAIDLFDSILEQTYSDSCCHYTQIGNDILADFVAEKMIDDLSSH